MQTTKSATDPVDGQLVPFMGIHPFYLTMTFPEFLKTLTGWTVIKAHTDEPGHEAIVLEKNGIEVELEFHEPDLDPSLGPLDFRHLGSISCNNALFDPNTELYDLSARELSTRTGVDFVHSPEPGDAAEELNLELKFYSSRDADEDDYHFLVTEDVSRISSIFLMRLVPGTYVE